ncbi:hypothetical protein GCM10009830_35150 [Glycomyces endophyticus]|uniref:DUF5666 domain-containing protein n=1 Tax=Glycomyces endophyticus TaxID=480996 RepID=A0ABP4TA98_9ACTN
MAKSDTVLLKAVKDDDPPEIAPMPDDLEQALAKRRPWTNKATKWIAAAVLVAGGFAGGVAVQQQWGADAGTGTADTGGMPDMSAMAEGGFPGGGMPGGFGGQETTGTVTAVDGATVTITTEDGTEVTVITGDDTAVTSSEAIDLSGLAAGDTVTVTGETADDGTVTADAVERTAAAE